MADAILGEIRAFAFPYAINGWARCDGQLIPVSGNEALFSLLGTTFGGDGIQNFALPDIRGRMVLGEGQFVDNLYKHGEKGGTETVILSADNLPAHTHALQCNNGVAKTGSPVNSVLAVVQGGSQAYITAEQSGKTHDLMDSDSISASGAGGALNNMPPFLTMNYCIATEGIYPMGGGIDSYMGEIKTFAFDYNRIPEGWVPCDGRQMYINQNAALYSLLGARFGGDGRTTFNLPDLRGRVPMYSRSNLKEGKGGTRTNTLTAPQLPAHTHVLNSDKNMGSQATPRTNFWGATTANYYTSDAPNGALDESVITPAGKSEPYNHMPPYLAANACICVSGMYPPRS